MGVLRNIERAFRKPIKQIVKHLPTIVGAGLGSAALGPIGGIIAPAIIGTTTRGHGNKLKGALEGGGLGAAYTAAAPTIAEYVGAEPESFLHKISGAGHPSLAHQFGISSAPSIGGGLGLFGNYGNKGLLESTLKQTLSDPALSEMTSQISPGFLEKMSSTFLDNLGKLGAHHDQKGKEEANIDIYNVEAPTVSRGSAGSIEAPRMETFLRSPQAQSFAHEGPSALEMLMSLLNKEANHKALGFKPQKKKSYEHKGSHVIPSSHDTSRMGEEKKFNHGGKVLREPSRLRRVKGSGYIHGYSGGQTDDRPTEIPEGSYVMNATRVSLLGDGNSNNGAAKLKKLEDNFLKSGIIRDTGGSRNIKALVSDGEYIIRKPIVDALGNGNNKRGAKILDQFGKNISKQKGVKGIVQPKSKPLHYYLGGR